MAGGWVGWGGVGWVEDESQKATKPLEKRFDLLPPHRTEKKGGTASN